MAYARKVPVKTDHVQCLRDFPEHIWNTFTRLSDKSKRIDIAFDLYIDSSTKGNERVRRKKSVQPIIRIIYNKDQKLTLTMQSFCASSTNKEQLQSFFIKWIYEKYDKDYPVYLGGCIPGDIRGCVNVCSRVVLNIPAMKCGHEGADNILFHINHAIKGENYTKIIVASPDTDVFVSCLFHLTRWVYMCASEMWVLCGRGLTKRAIPFHRIVYLLDISATDVLPAIHFLTVCDTTNIIGKKRAALKLGETDRSEMLISFGKEALKCNVNEATEKFLVGYISNKSGGETFAELRCKLYHSNSVKFD